MHYSLLEHDSTEDQILMKITQAHSSSIICPPNFDGSTRLYTECEQTPPIDVHIPGEAA